MEIVFIEEGETAVEPVLIPDHLTAPREETPGGEAAVVVPEVSAPASSVREETVHEEAMALPTPSSARRGLTGWWPWRKKAETIPAGESSQVSSVSPEASREEEREQALAERLSAEQPADWFAPDGAPYLRPGFSIKVSVIAGGIVEVPEMVRTISDKGTITLPLVGQVGCLGLTVRTLSERLTEEYSRFLKDPSVSVDYVYEGRPGEVSPWGWVSVYGAVNSPGRINIPPSRDLTLSRAIQFAGGLNRVARETDIRIWRRTHEGPRRIVVNLLDIAKRGMIEKDLTLEPGDIIFVPESVW